MAPVTPQLKPNKNAKQKRHEASESAGNMDLFCDYDVVNPPGSTYSKISSDTELGLWLLELSKPQPIVLDIETAAKVGRPKSSLNPWEGSIRLIQIGLGGKVLLLDMLTCGDRPVVVQLLDLLKTACESDQWLIVGAGLKFEMTWLGIHYGFRFNRIFCTEVASRLLWAGLSDYGSPVLHGLKPLVGRVLGRNISKDEQNSTWANPLLTQSQLDYAALDAVLPGELLPKLTSLLREGEMINLARIEFNALIVYSEMEIFGCPIDVGKLGPMIEVYRAALALARIPYDEQFPGLGLHSSKKSALVDPPLGSDYQYPEGLYSAIFALTGAYPPSLDAEFLEIMAPTYPSIEALLVSRAITGSLNYLLKLKASIGKGDRAHPSYRSLAPQGRGRGTSGSAGEASPAVHRQKTGEVLSINVQNCPNGSKARYKNFLFQGEKLPDMRSLFAVGPGSSLPDHEMGGADFNAAHGRICAVVTGDPLMIESYKDESVDLHCELAALIANHNGTDWDGPTLKLNRKAGGELASKANGFRNVAKNCYYLWINGGGVGRVLLTLVAAGFDSDNPRGILDSLRSRFVGVSKFHDKIRYECKTKRFWQSFQSIGVNQLHYRCRSRDGRIVWVPVKDTEYGPSANPNDALMCFWMGPESTAKKVAMGKIRDLFNQHPEWDAHLWLDCHDELGYVCLKAHAKVCFTECDQIMNDALSEQLGGIIPPTSETYVYGPGVVNWAQCK